MIMMRQREKIMTRTVQRETIAIPLLWFGLAQSSHLAFLSKVLCEFFQFVQILFIDCWLCVGQRPQHVRLKRQKQTNKNSVIVG